MSQDEIIQRWAFSVNPPDLTGSGVVEYHCRHWNGVYLTRVHATRVVQFDIANRQDLKDAHDFAVIPPTTADAGELPIKVLAILDMVGIAIGPKDKVLHVLRKLRNLKENSFGFDISD